MKKNFFKKLALSLALAMVVTSAAPAASASAAAKPSLAKRYTNVYDGKTYTYTVKNVKKGYTVKWAVSGKGSEFAALSKKTTKATGTTVSNKLTITTNGDMAAKNAKTAVTATVYDAKGNRVVGQKNTVTIKVTATDLAIKPADGVDAAAVPANESVKFNRVITPANSTSTTYWTVVDKDGNATDKATIDAKGNFKATVAGDYTIKAEAKNAKAGVVKASAELKVTVGAKIVSVTAKTPKKLDVVFSSALEKVEKEAFTVVTADTNTKAYVKSATLADDKKTVTVEFFDALTNGKTYNVTAKVDNIESTGSVDFKQGAVKSITGENQFAPAGVDYTVKYTVLDEYGLDITDSTTVYISSNVTCTNGVVNLAHGVLGKFEVVYTNPTTGAQIKSNEFTVTGSNKVVNKFVDFTIAETRPAKWPEKVTTSVAKGTNNKAVFVQTVDQYNNKVIANGGVEFESLDPRVFVIDKTTGVITTVAEGTGQFRVKSGDISTIFTLTVTPTAKATSLAIDSASVLKASLTNPTENKASLKVNVLDQNGEKFNNGNTLQAEVISGEGILNDGSDDLKVGDKRSFAAGVAVDLYAAKAGTAVFKITNVTEGSVPFITAAITVDAENNIQVSYDFTGLSELNIEDFYDNDSTTTAVSNAGVKVVAKNSAGFTVEVLTDAVVTVKNPDGKAIVDAKLSGVTAEFAKLTVDQDCNKVGTYKLEAVKNGKTIAVASFTVKDTGVKPGYAVTTNTADKGTVDMSKIVKFDEGWNVTNVKFIPSNKAAVSYTPDANGYYSVGGSSITVTDTTILTNITLTVQNASGRTYDIAIGDLINVK